MTLKEKFENNVIGINGEIKIADDYAIMFADWLDENELEIAWDSGNLTTKELLEIFKKEKKS